MKNGVALATAYDPEAHWLTVSLRKPPNGPEPKNGLNKSVGYKQQALASCVSFPLDTLLQACIMLAPHWPTHCACHHVLGVGRLESVGRKKERKSSSHVWGEGSNRGTYFAQQEALAFPGSHDGAREGDQAVGKEPQERAGVVGEGGQDLPPVDRVGPARVRELRGPARPPVAPPVDHAHAARRLRVAEGGLPPRPVEEDPVERTHGCGASHDAGSVALVVHAAAQGMRGGRTVGEGGKAGGVGAYDGTDGEGRGQLLLRGADRQPPSVNGRPTRRRNAAAQWS